MTILSISSDVIKYFACTLKPTHCVLKGISKNKIVTREYTTSIEEFEEICLEVDFVVLSSSCMNTTIVIGTDVLNRNGVTFFRIRDNQYLTNSSKRIFKVNTVEADKLSGINTPLRNGELDLLMKVIDDFSQFLISGTASLYINLTSEIPVAYHPYIIYP